MRCYYCDLIHATDPAYALREAEFDQGAEAPRCIFHWRFICDHCGQPGHFMSRFYCPHEDRILCREVGEVAPEVQRFWAWEYYWNLHCPQCGERHPSLDYAEFAQVHPWQLDHRAAAGRRWLSAEAYLVRYPPKRLPRLPSDALTDPDLDASWSANYDVWEAGYDERGDVNRKYISDPVLFRLLGDVGGQRVLDAGSGAGYLSRLLVRRGARMVAVENSTRAHEIALAHQARDPLPIEFHHSSISSMPFLEDASCDAAVANYVLMDVRDYESALVEITRVLKPGGRLIAVISYSTLDFRWVWAAPDSPRREDRLGWSDDDYFVRRAGYIQWGQLKPFISFHRPLRDYVAAAGRSGLGLRDLDQPEVSEEGLRELPSYYLRSAQRVPFSYVLKFVKEATDLP